MRCIHGARYYYCSKDGVLLYRPLSKGTLCVIHKTRTHTHSSRSSPTMKMRLNLMTRSTEEESKFVNLFVLSGHSTA